MWQTVASLYVFLPEGGYQLIAMGPKAIANSDVRKKMAAMSKLVHSNTYISTAQWTWVRVMACAALASNSISMVTNALQS